MKNFPLVKELYRKPLMADNLERYSRLAPLSIELRKQIAVSAVHFFSPRDYKSKCTKIGKTPESNKIIPFDGSDFTKFLEVTGVLEEPLRYIAQIRQLLNQMDKAGVLLEMGNSSNVPM